MVAEIGYSGVMGEHLQTVLLDYNQISPSYLTALRNGCAEPDRVEQPGGFRDRQRGRHQGSLRRLHAALSRRLCGRFRSIT